MKLLSFLFVASLGLSGFSHAAISQDPASYRMGYSISESDINDMLAKLAGTGAMDHAVSGTTAAGWVNYAYKATFEDASVTFNQSNQTIGATLKVRVRAGFVFSEFRWPTDLGIEMSTTMTPIVSDELSTAGKKIQFCPVPLANNSTAVVKVNGAVTGWNFLDERVRNAISELLSNSVSCVNASAMSSLYPYTFGGYVLSKDAMPYIEWDRITYGITTKPYRIKYNGPRIDYDGDGKADVSELNGSNWVIDYSANGFGTKQTVPIALTGHGVPGDYDNDGRTDIAVRNPTSGVWNIDYAEGGFGSFNASFATNWGSTASIPVPADYDGDGITDLAIFNNYYGSVSGYVIDYSSNGFNGPDFDSWYQGLPPTDMPAPADYDGDGKADLSLKNTSGQWGIDYAADGFTGWNVVYSGYGYGYEYVPAPADFDGDGKADLVVLHKTSGGNGWGIDYSANGFGGIEAWHNGHITYSYTKPMPSDYDGDGRADIAVKNDDGYWAIDYAADGFGSWNVVSGSWGNGSAQPFHKSAVEPEIAAVVKPFDFSFNLPRDSRVKVVAFSIEGKQIATLFDGHLKEGANNVGWTKADLAAKGLKGGMYVFSLQANGFKTSKRVLFSE